MWRPLSLLVLVVGGSVVGCDDGENRTPPDTALDAVPALISKDTHVSITFHALGNANGFLCKLDGNAPGQCISPFEADVTEGMHTFEVSAAVGTAVDETPATHAWRIDATAPDTTLVTMPPAVDNTVNPTFTFNGSDPGGGAVTFECKIDGGVFAVCTSPDQHTLGDGAHTFTVRAVDVAGNVDASPPAHTWTIDSSTPDTAITSGPAAASTSQANVSFAFTSPDANATFECLVDSGTYTACVSPHALPGLVDGSHTFTVRAKSSAGTLDPTPATRTWTVDGTAPTVMITSNPTNPSNDATPAFGFSSPDATATFQCQVDGTVTFTSCTSIYTSPTLADGAHVFRVKATDPVGNTGPEATYSWTIDTMPPAVTITSGPMGTVASANATFTFTTGGSPTTTDCDLDGSGFSACAGSKTYSGVADGPHTFTVRVRDAAMNMATDTRSFTVDTMGPVVTITNAPASPNADNTPTYMFTVTGATTIECGVDGTFVACANTFTTGVLADGPHTFVVRAFDAVGNPGSDSRSITIDTTGPTVAIVTKPANPTNSTTGTFTFTVSEGSPTCQLDGGAFMACTSGIAYTSLADGSHTFTVQAMDALGNPGSATYTWTIDATGPTVTITAPPTTPSTDQTPTTGFTVTGGAVTTTCKIDLLPAVTCAPPSYTSPALGDGTHTILITATDALGNPGTASATFVIDTTGPIVTFDAVPPAKWPVNYFSMQFHANEPATFECSLNGAAFTTCTTGISITTTYNVLSSFAVRAKDGLGNQGGTVTTTWTSSDGLVLHYPWEQGSTLNTSLLSQDPSYSPKGSITVPVVGGWAGTATRAPAAHKYSGTKPALSSSATGTYTGGVWLRPRAGADGVLWSNVNATLTGGHRIRLSGTTVILETYNAAGQLFSTTGTVAFNQWSHVAVRTTGPAKGLELLINGGFIALVNPGAQTGFDASQDTDLLVGPIFNADADDLRFYNIAISGNATCTTLVRGVFNAQGACVPMRPGYELDFENTPLANSGTLQVSVGEPLTYTTFAGTLGLALKMGVSQTGLDLTKYAAAAVLPGHSIALWVDGSTPADTLLDFTRPCSFVANFGTCGIQIVFTAQRRVGIFAGTGLANQLTAIVPASPLSATRAHSIVVAEQKSGAQTTGLKIYIDGRLEQTLTVTAGDVFGIVNDKITMVSQPASVVDEIELWPRDLSADPEMLCENGFDGEFDLVNLTCSLTAN